MKPQEILSQEEIDALLNAVHSGEVGVSGAAPSPTSERPALRYSFRRPSRISKDQLRTLQVLHDDFVKLFSASLSGILRSVVDLEVEAVEQIAYAEYTMAIATPACAFIFNMEPLKGGAVLELNSQMAFAMIDRLLGGSGAHRGTVREFTEIERAVIERIGLRAMVDLQQSWQQVGAFVMRILNLETNPQFLQITSPNEVVVVASFRLKMGEVTAGMTIAYPYLLLEPLIPRFGAQRWLSSLNIDQDPEARTHITTEVLETRLPVRVVLGRATLRVRDLLELGQGSLISLDTGPDIPATVEIGELAKFKGKPGVSRNRLALAITSRVSERNGIR
ncbi:MAG: flagellar motor switch protein FliM [Candidatus Methylomirabilia bacterium]